MTGDLQPELGNKETPPSTSSLQAYVRLSVRVAWRHNIPDHETAAQPRRIPAECMLTSPAASKRCMQCLTSHAPAPPTCRTLSSDHASRARASRHTRWSSWSKSVSLRRLSATSTCRVGSRPVVLKGVPGWQQQQPLPGSSTQDIRTTRSTAVAQACSLQHSPACAQQAMVPESSKPALPVSLATPTPHLPRLKVCCLQGKALIIQGAQHIHALHVVVWLR
jgi:hypothetical protein